MTVKQISVFLENRPGTLAAATDTLSRGGINLRALCVADTRDFGILRIIADDPGSLSRVLHVLAAAGISVEYTYAFLAEQVENGAVVVLRVNDADKATQVLLDNGVTLGDEKLFS